CATSAWRHWPWPPGWPRGPARAAARGPRCWGCWGSPPRRRRSRCCTAAGCAPPVGEPGSPRGWWRRCSSPSSSAGWVRCRRTGCGPVRPPGWLPRRPWGTR
ncbi:MAG: hypothetical protein AVDCRST_MAG48-574, partial [uncultured Friedmanniella sp.]